MSYVLLAIFGIVAALVVAKASANRAGTSLVPVFQITGAIALYTLALLTLLLAPSRFGFGMMLASLATVLLVYWQRGRVQPMAGPMGQGGGAGQSAGSQVRTRWLEMTLDHATGAMHGTVREGAYAGVALDQLSLPDLETLYLELKDDMQSVQLLEAWLDRKDPEWRDAFGAAENSSQKSGWSGGASRGPTSRAEALAILGLDETASDDKIRSTHRELMKKLHPDQGGSTVLATQINAARALLLDE
ncbi:MAG: DnaJ domain-containing protein [Pseudomonadota bacterium]